MDSIACLFIALICAAMPLQVRSVATVTGLYGETLVIPCNNGASPPEGLMFTKWKYEKDDGSSGDLLVKQAHKSESTVQATDSYAPRVSIADNSSLLISQGTLKDQRMFTCMVVSVDNLMEYPVNVLVYKKPSLPQIMDKANELDKDTLEMLGTCVVKDANPAAELKWAKNGQPLVADGRVIIISPSVKVVPATGLSTTSSSLQYTATKADIGARFTCLSTHKLLATHQESAPETFTIRYPTEKVTLQVLPKGLIREGDNVTLKCLADGNPPPSSFNFHIKGKKVMLRDTDSYTLLSITREGAGEYKCSMVDDEKIVASQNIDVTYLDLKVSPTGKIVKTVGDSLVVKMEKNASGDARVSWTKNGKAIEAPKFGQLTYADTGIYACQASLAGITRSQSFELVVEGTAVITRLTKQRGEDGQHKVLTCEAEGVPQPTFQWSVNGTQEEGSYSNGKATQKITVVPKANLTVTCSVSNKLGEDVKTINVSSLFKEETQEKGAQDDDKDQAKLIVGIVVGLLIAAAVVALAYWIYMKKSRQGSWKTGEKEAGTSEEEKKLEENNHKQEA